MGRVIQLHAGAPKTAAKPSRREAYVDVVVKRRYHITYSEQREYDPDDGTPAGWYAWVGSGPDDPSDFVLGPYATLGEAEIKAPQRLHERGV